MKLLKYLKGYGDQLFLPEIYDLSWRERLKDFLDSEAKPRLVFKTKEDTDEDDQIEVC